MWILVHDQLTNNFSMLFFILFDYPKCLFSLSLKHVEYQINISYKLVQNL